MIFGLLVMTLKPSDNPQPDNSKFFVCKQQTNKQTSQDEREFDLVFTDTWTS